MAELLTGRTLFPGTDHILSKSDFLYVVMNTQTAKVRGFLCFNEKQIYIVMWYIETTTRCINVLLLRKIFLIIMSHRHLYERHIGTPDTSYLSHLVLNILVHLRSHGRVLGVYSKIHP